MSNHLGNVLAVVTDKKIFTSEVIEAVDYNGEIVDLTFDNYASYWYAQGNCGATYPTAQLNNGQLQMNFLADFGCSQYNSLDFNYSTGDCAQDVIFSFDLEFTTATKLLMQIRDGNNASLGVFWVQEGHVSFPVSSTTSNMRIKFFGRGPDNTQAYSLNIDNLKIEFQGTPTCAGSGYIADIAKATDYSPFGVELYERGFTRDEYRFGFNQGSEADDEISGKGNTYSTYYRPLNTRLGRWWSIDPKKSASESPYVSMGNTPIWANDPLGDKFIKGSERKAKKSERQANRRINTLTKHLKKAKENDAGAKKIDDIKAQIEQVNKVIGGIQDMRGSEQNYIIRNSLLIVNKSKRGKGLKGLVGGATVYNTKSDAVVITSVGKKTKFHELTHGHQYHKGELSFEKATKKDKEGKTVLEKFQSAGELYDINDEVDAYKTSYAFGDRVFSHYKKRGEVLIDLKPSHITKAAPGAYGDLPTNNRNANDGKTPIYHEDEFFIRK